MVLLAHLLAVRPVPGLRVGGDHALGRLVRLAEEEPVPPRGGEARVAAVERLGDRHGVQHGERVDGVGMVQRGAEGDVGAAVVADDGEALVAERAHQRRRSRGPSRAWSTARGRPVGGLGRLAVAAQVGADDRVPARRGAGATPVPGRVRARVPVEQDHGGPDPPWRTRSTASPTSTRSSANPSNTAPRVPRPCSAAKPCGRRRAWAGALDPAPGASPATSPADPLSYRVPRVRRRRAHRHERRPDPRRLRVGGRRPARVIPVAWLAAAVLAWLYLPPLGSSGQSPLGDIVPAQSAAISAQQRALRLFGSTVLTDTVRGPAQPARPRDAPRSRGWSAARATWRGTGSRATSRRPRRGPARQRAGARRPLAGEGTTALTYLFIGAGAQPARARRGGPSLRRPLRPRPRPGIARGVTGAGPARLAQYEEIDGVLPWVEAATVAVILVIVALVLPLGRGAAGDAVHRVAIAYVVAVRALAWSGRAGRRDRAARDRADPRRASARPRHGLHDLLHVRGEAPAGARGAAPGGGARRDGADRPDRPDGGHPRRRAARARCWPASSSSSASSDRGSRCRRWSSRSSASRSSRRCSGWSAPRLFGRAVREAQPPPRTAAARHGQPPPAAPAADAGRAGGCAPRACAAPIARAAGTGASRAAPRCRSSPPGCSPRARSRSSSWSRASPRSASPRARRARSTSASSSCSSLPADSEPRRAADDAARGFVPGITVAGRRHPRAARASPAAAPSWSG